MADQGADRAILSGELWLPPGGYVVLARMGDPAQNGGGTDDVYGLVEASEMVMLLVFAARPGTM